MAITFENPPPSTDSSSSGSSSGGSSSASDKLNYQKALEALLQSLQIPMTANLSQLINQAAAKGYTQSTFMYYLRQTPEYTQAFPGILAADGTLKMSEQQYVAQVRQYQEIAGLYGLRLNERGQAALFEGDTSPNEYRVRAQAIRQLKDNEVYLQQFNKVLLAKGIVDHRLTPQELQKFILGEADPEWYRVWREAQVRGAAVMAGLNFGKPGTHPKGQDLRLPKGALHTLMAAGLTGTALQNAVENIAQNFLNTLPLSQVYREGLTKKDIVKAIAGGKHSATIQARIERLLNTSEAFNTEERANPQLYSSEPGTTQVLGGAPRRVASE